ncbi:MAG: ABC transporter ATP-binding protein [Candidatus Rokuibacteriota bacterium]|nr:MAG: ABC transporter ATP-binding protein [Candidatus Rokubacteria bacterium]PYN68537.1 MAG: ABC transporter ATP-binding protein [Candidatus Rokubacteria bacterium]
MLSVEGLEARYGSVAAVKGVSLEVGVGEIVGVLGPNGAGKTTTLLSVIGLVRPAGGHVRFLGRDITGLTPDRVAAAGIGLVPEGRWILASMSVRDNLLLGAYLRQDGNAAVAREIDRVCEIFPILRERQAQRAGTLSGGEQQMLGIARALMSRPRLLMLDEPTWGLAPLVVEEIMRVIKRLNQEGTTILLVEQNARQALAVVQRCYVLAVGQVVWSGTPAGLAREPLLIKAYLGAAASRIR